MKTSFYIITVLMITILAACVKEKEISTTQADNFLKMYGSYKANEGYDLKQTSDGGYIITGKTMISELNEDIILIKTDQYGNQEWEKTFDVENGNDSGNSLEIDSDGGFIIFGTCTNLAGNTDMFLLKTNSTGDSLWSRQIDVLSLDQDGKSVKTTVDGGYILVGTTEVIGVDGTHKDIYMVKMDASGNKIWGKTYGSSTEDDDARCVIENYDNKYMIIGKTKSFPINPNDVSYNIYVTINSPVEGTVINFCTYGKSSEDEGVGVVKTSETNYIMAGTISDNSTKKIYVRKFGNDQSSGLQDSIWVKNFNGTGNTFARSISSTGDNGIVIVGMDVDGTNSDIYIIKIDNDGNEIFSQTFGGEKRDEGNAVIETNDNGFAIIGTTEYDNRSMICLIKTNSVGNL